MDVLYNCFFINVFISCIFYHRISVHCLCKFFLKDGELYCHYSFITNVHFYLFNVLAITAPEIDKSACSNINRQVGEKAKMKCKPFESRTFSYNITWFKNGQLLFQNNSLDRVSFFCCDFHSYLIHIHVLIAFTLI